MAPLPVAPAAGRGEVYHMHSFKYLGGILFTQQTTIPIGNMEWPAPARDAYFLVIMSARPRWVSIFL